MHRSSRPGVSCERLVNAVPCFRGLEPGLTLLVLCRSIEMKRGSSALCRGCNVDDCVILSCYAREIENVSHADGYSTSNDYSLWNLDVVPRFNGA